MTIRKWRFSSKRFVETIPPPLRKTENLLITPEDRPLKTLGLHWDVTHDQLSVAIPTIQDNQKTTKRIVASTLGKVYDLLGFYSPVTIKAKLILKKLWQNHTGWDKPVSADIEASWNLWTSQLATLSKHKINRCYASRMNVKHQSLHGFSDASQEAYGGVIYLRTEHDDQTISIAMVMSKSRVVSLKGMTIPRAELTAAHMLAKLLHHCSTLLQIKTIYAWSDFFIVLCWLRKSL